MGRYCYKCRVFREKTQNVSLHRLPREEAKRKLWIYYLGFNKDHEFPKRVDFCDVHFNPFDLFTCPNGGKRLITNALPIRHLVSSNNERNIEVEEDYVPQMNYCILNTYSRKKQSSSVKIVNAATVSENTNSHSSASSTEIEDIKVEFEELIYSEDVKDEKHDPEYEDIHQIYCTLGNVSDASVLGKIKEEIQPECIDAQQDHCSTHNISEDSVFGEIKEEIKTECIDFLHGRCSTDNISEGLDLGEIKEEMKTECIHAQQGHCNLDKYSQDLALGEIKEEIKTECIDFHQDHCKSDNISEGLGFEELFVEEIKEEIKTECVDDYDVSTNDFHNLAGCIKTEKCDY